MVKFAYIFHLLWHIYPIMNIFLTLGAIIVKTMLAIRKILVSLYSLRCYFEAFCIFWLFSSRDRTKVS